ncbi:hypothetical protein DICA0_E35256 [Diutina catenulata]
MEDISRDKTVLDQFLANPIDQSWLVGFFNQIHPKLDAAIAKEVTAYVKTTDAQPDTAFTVKSAVDKVWAEFHYPVVRFYKAQVAQVFRECQTQLAESGVFKPRAVEARKAMADWQKWQRAAVKFYEGLAVMLLTSYRLPMVPRRVRNAYVETPVNTHNQGGGEPAEPQSASPQATETNLVYLLHRLLLAVADLQRHDATLDVTYVTPCLSHKHHHQSRSLRGVDRASALINSFTRALDTYHQCIWLMPTIGEPYNHIGMIYNTVDDRFRAVVWFLRSQFTRMAQFGVGQSNLNAIVNKDHFLQQISVKTKIFSLGATPRELSLTNSMLMCLVGFIYAPSVYDKQKNGQGTVLANGQSQEKLEAAFLRAIEAQWPLVAHTHPDFVLNQLVVVLCFCELVGLGRNQGQIRAMERLAFRFIDKVLETVNRWLKSSPPVEAVKPVAKEPVKQKRKRVRKKKGKEESEADGAEKSDENSKIENSDVDGTQAKTQGTDSSNHTHISVVLDGPGEEEAPKTDPVAESVDGSTQSDGQLDGQLDETAEESSPVQRVVPWSMLAAVRLIFAWFKETTPALATMHRRYTTLQAMVQLLNRLSASNAGVPASRPTRAYYFTEDVDFKDFSVIKYQFKDFTDDRLFNDYDLMAGDFSGLCDDTGRPSFLGDHPSVMAYESFKRTEAVLNMGKRLLEFNTVGIVLEDGVFTWNQADIAAMKKAGSGSGTNSAGYGSVAANQAGAAKKGPVDGNSYAAQIASRKKKPQGTAPASKEVSAAQGPPVAPAISMEDLQTQIASHLQGKLREGSPFAEDESDTSVVLTSMVDSLVAETPSKDDSKDDSKAKKDAMKILRKPEAPEPSQPVVTNQNPVVNNQSQPVNSQSQPVVSQGQQQNSLNTLSPALGGPLLYANPFPQPSAYPQFMPVAPQSFYGPQQFPQYQQQYPQYQLPGFMGGFSGAPQGNIWGTGSSGPMLPPQGQSLANFMPGQYAQGQQPQQPQEEQKGWSNQYPQYQ